MRIKEAPYFDYYEGEETPPLDGPVTWFRPSDGAHFSRVGTVWRRYIPIHEERDLGVGECTTVFVPKITT